MPTVSSDVISAHHPAGVKLHASTVESEEHSSYFCCPKVVSQ
jgi:hypothetical protein